MESASEVAIRLLQGDDFLHKQIQFWKRSSVNTRRGGQCSNVPAGRVSAVLGKASFGDRLDSASRNS